MLYGKEIPMTNEQYIDPENGYDLVLTLDETIQSITEKYLEQAVIESDCTDGGVAIIMKPKTGEILAMASEPSYNLNEPFTPNTNALKQAWESLSKTDRNIALQKMWRNKAVADTYEPGSTFKLITTAIALEENMYKTDTPNNFYCKGSITISGVTMKCWRYYNPHGSETLRNALQNSCNPVFIQMGQEIGVSRFYKYLEAFGFFETTGSSLSGETKGIFFKEDKVGPIELGTISFGQRFQITPLQLINSVCAIANEGKLMKPQIVKEIRDVNKNVVTTIEPEVYRQVISKKTCDDLLSMMESVVSDGTGRMAQVKGYQIGGKTGTADQGVNTGKYVASFIGVAPALNPEVVILIALYNPTGEHGGGSLAAPTTSKILSEVLKYLEIQPDFAYTDDVSVNAMVPEVRNKTVAEAIKKIEEMGFKCEYTGSGDKNTLQVVDQMPKPGVNIPTGSIIKIYSEGNDVRNSVKVPDLKGLTPAQATTKLKSMKLNIKVSGTGVAYLQDPMVGTEVEEGTVINVDFKPSSNDVH